MSISVEMAEQMKKTKYFFQMALTFFNNFGSRLD